MPEPKREPLPSRCCQRCGRLEHVGPWLEPGTYTQLCVWCKLEACGIALPDLVDATDSTAVRDVTHPEDPL